MSVYDIFETDKSLESDGITLEYPGFKIKVRRAGGANELYKYKLREKLGPYDKNLSAIKDDKAALILAETFAESVVVGWEGVKDRDGKSIPFSVENCTKLFIDLPEFFKDVQERANSLENFKSKVEEEDIKN